MSARTMMVLVLALVFGGAAVVLVNSLQKQAPAAKVETVPIVVAVADLPRGTTIAATAVKIRDVPKDQAPEGAVTKVEDAISRLVFIPVVKGDIVLEGKLAPKGARGGLDGLIPKGMRAFSIQTPNISSAVAGFVLPGNKVDVLLTMNNTNNDDEDGGGTTSTLLQNVEILAVEDQIDTPNSNKVDANKLRSVTLLVTPDQAAMLDLGQIKGTLHLSLRSFNDEKAASPKVATVNGLIGRQTKPKPKPEPTPAAPPVVQAEPEPEPEPAPAPPEPIELQIRTMRGTALGQDRVFMPAPAPQAAPARPKRGRAPAASPSTRISENPPAPANPATGRKAPANRLPDSPILPRSILSGKGTSV